MSTPKQTLHDEQVDCGLRPQRNDRLQGRSRVVAGAALLLSTAWLIGGALGDALAASARHGTIDT